MCMYSMYVYSVYVYTYTSLYWPPATVLAAPHRTTEPLVATDTRGTRGVKTDTPQVSKIMNWSREERSSPTMPSTMHVCPDTQVRS